MSRRLLQKTIEAVTEFKLAYKFVSELNEGSGIPTGQMDPYVISLAAGLIAQTRGEDSLSARFARRLAEAVRKTPNTRKPADVRAQLRRNAEATLGDTYDQEKVDDAIAEDDVAGAPQIPFVSPVEDPDKATAAANLIARQYPERNKITMMAHSAAAEAHDRAAQMAMSAGDVETAESHERSRDRHLYDPKGPLAGQSKPKAFRFKAPRIPKKRGRKKKEVHIA